MIRPAALYVESVALTVSVHPLPTSRKHLIVDPMHSTPILSPLVISSEWVEPNWVVVPLSMRESVRSSVPAAAFHWTR